MITRFKRFTFLTLLLMLPTLVMAQFYNGHQMKFGKNRVQFNDFYWSFYRFERFDTYFNQDGKELAQYVSNYANTRIRELENQLDYRLDKRVIFLVYNKLTDFRQSNIGLVTGEDDSNIGGVTQIIDNKVFLYFEGDYRKLEKQISAAIAEVLLNQMLYGSDLKDKVANNAMIALPDWFFQGLVSYVAEPWSYEIENKVRDGIINGNYEKFNRLRGDDARIAGHSIWYFLTETFGESIIPDIIYLTRINKNTNSGFMQVLGITIKDLSYDWLGFYIDRFGEHPNPEDYIEGERLKKRPKKNTVYFNLTVSPDGSKLAYVTNQMGQYKIWLYDEEKQKSKKIVKREHKLEQINDYSYPVLAWHPRGNILTFIIEEEGRLTINYYNIESKELTTRNLLYFDKILDFSYSHDGTKFVFSAVKDGRTDIFVHTIAAGTNEQITNDLADDFSPRFTKNSSEIIFSSNRLTDTLNLEYNVNEKLSLTKDLFIYKYNSTSPLLYRLKNYPYSNSFDPIPVRDDRFVFLSDQNGIYNRYYTEIDSAIQFVDTSIHYAYNNEVYPISNYKTNILEHDISSNGKVGEVFFDNERFRINRRKLNISNPFRKGEMKKTVFSETYKGELQENDSLRQVIQKAPSISEIDSIAHELLLKDENTYIDVNQYIFEVEKLNNFRYNQYLKYGLDNFDTTTFDFPKIRIYETSFYNNYVVSQIDFSFLNSSYQSFTGGGIYYNPGFNAMFKIGANDLFEDYKLVGGVKFSTDFQDNEYLISIENLKNRTDKQLILHRQAFKNAVGGDTLVKITTNEMFYILSYPLSQVSAIKGTANLRWDQHVYLSTNADNLYRASENRYWAGIKFEYIFDNTIKRGINIYNGTRYKVFAEAYKMLNEKSTDLFVWGFDFRHYTKIHRDLILASRVAGSTSFGRARLLYYLGAVDGWTTFNPTVQTFDQSVPINEQEKYAYQTLATNMRGFSQNIRNGNNFALINNEIRWPFIRYFANHPIGSAFWNNLQVVGFFDVGTAWTGLTPYSGENAYDSEILENGPITVTIDSNREPIVAGYGWGVRTQLFGYFVRLDWAWGIENYQILPRIFYLSLNLDF